MNGFIHRSGNTRRRVGLVCSTLLTASVSSIILVLFVLSGCTNTTSADSDKILINDSAYILEDGATVSTWQFPNDHKLLYLLDDGTELVATAISVPDAGMVMDGEPSNQLSPAVQNSINAFYAQGSEEYSVQEYLEKAYAEYTAQEDRSGFRCYYIQQSTSISGMNAGIVYCTTSFLLPIDQEEHEQYDITRAFDRETGALIEGWDLFYGTKDEIVSALLFPSSDCGTDPDAFASLSAEFKPEYVRFDPDQYVITFPKHTGQNFTMTSPYTEKVRSVLHEWAIPN